MSGRWTRIPIHRATGPPKTASFTDTEPASAKNENGGRHQPVPVMRNSVPCCHDPRVQRLKKTKHTAPGVTRGSSQAP